MKRTTGSAVIAALFAASGFFAVPASAHSVANHCGHGAMLGDGGHEMTVWEGSNGDGNRHAHQYKHAVDWARDHHYWQGCPE
jgi:hypothetical protein